MTALAHNHLLKGLLEFQKKKKWEDTNRFREVTDFVGQRLGVLGYGSIGRQVARVGKAMGMDIIAYTASPRDTPESKHDKGFIVPGTGDPDGSIPSAWYSGLDKASLHHFLKQDIDVLLISVPLTNETTHFLGREEFEILGQNRQAFISNISRGQIVNQDEMIAALKRKPEDGGLRGAALDVTDPEPLPEDSELWDLSNVIVTPHISGSGSAYVDRAFQVLDLNITRLEKGEELINTVNRKRGY
ncbi:MAG: Transcription factor spt8 [Chaenotheca gracillima]|nr:MAG: Transcription factor spt8 [Chaenotheca gracillima]